MKRLIGLMCGLIIIMQASGQTGVLDEITFGDKKSESKHAFSEKASKVIKGGLGQSARVLLPIPGERVEGGNIHFKLKVDPNQQNYVTVRLWGSDAGDKNILILFAEGKQVGY